MARDHRRAFTLIEVLIVVIIMAVLAATIIPQFSSSTRDAKDSALKFNLHSIRSQIEMYKSQHWNMAPALATFSNQMTKKTDVSGVVGIGEAYIYGPYFQGNVPVNPFNNKNTLVATTATTEAEAKAIVTGSDGWLYNATSGDFFPDYVDYYRN
jgi:prepilin-type N-terminal cleavage/methylation domain-containing protein